jgi:septum formation protein
MLELVLVSKSPRRKEILENAGFLFSVDTMEVSEIIDENMNPMSIACTISKSKGQAYINTHKSLKGQRKLAVSADTLVVLGEKILGKPKSADEAVEFLCNLSGKTHSVITGLYIYSFETEEEFSGSDITKVEFKTLTDDEIKKYVQSGDPMDKAGAYGIQSEAKSFVKKFEGSYLNVVGFPLELFERVLIERHWQIDRK